MNVMIVKRKHLVKQVIPEVTFDENTKHEGIGRWVCVKNES